MRARPLRDKGAFPRNIPLSPRRKHFFTDHASKTPIPGLSRPQTKLVDELFALDPRIRYVALLDRNSKLLESRMRSNVMSLTPETYDRKFMSSVPPMIIDTLSQLENQVGPLTHISIQYQKVDLVIFPHMSQIVAISLEPGPLEPILRKLRDNLNIHIHL
jgi:hypothetical protein